MTFLISRKSTPLLMMYEIMMPLNLVHQLPVKMKSIKLMVNKPVLPVYIWPRLPCGESDRL